MTSLWGTDQVVSLPMIKDVGSLNAGFLSSNEATPCADVICGNQGWGKWGEKNASTLAGSVAVSNNSLWP